MRIRALLLLIATLPLRAAGGWPVERVSGLCAADERPLFACSTKSKAVAVCARSGFAQYRFGQAGRIELAWPARPGAGRLYRAHAMYSGGGEDQIGFVTGETRYVAYSRMVRTRFDGHGNDPAFSAGVLVLRGGRQVADRRCTRPPDAAIDEHAAEKLLPEGEFTYASD